MCAIKSQRRRRSRGEEGGISLIKCLFDHFCLETTYVSGFTIRTYLTPYKSVIEKTKIQSQTVWTTYLQGAEKRRLES